MDYKKLSDELFRSMIKLEFNDLNRQTTAAMKGEHFVLLHLLHRPSCQPGELSQVMNASTAYISKLLRGMEQKGWLIRKQDAADRRRVFIALTDEGRKIAKSDLDRVRQMTINLFHYLGEEDSENFVRILGIIADLKQQYFHRHSGDSDD